MQIAIIGVTGYAGGHIADEALTRGHGVIGVSRTPPQMSPPGLQFRTGSIEDRALLEQLFAEADAVIVAVRSAVDGKPFLVHRVAELLELAAEHNTRLGFVGGGASLSAYAGGPRLLDAAHRTEHPSREPSSQALVLDALRAADTGADWFYLSPPAGFGADSPGERTGRYRIGRDVMLVGADGKATIGGADFAIALVDELDLPTHHQMRFTVGY